MDHFLSGKRNMLVAVMLIGLIPPAIAVLINETTFTAARIISTFLLTAFIFYLKRNDFIDRDKQKQKTEVSTLFLMIISALIIQLLYVSLMCSVFSMELTYSSKSFPSLLECISSIIAAPLYEEVFCRMSLTDIFISKETPPKNKVIFILLSALFFNCLHHFLVFDPHKIVLGIILGLIYMLSGNLFYCIIFHMACNFIAAFFESRYSDFLIPYFYSKACFFILIVLFVLFILAIFRKLIRTDENSDKEVSS